MKKIILLLILALIAQISPAQKTTYHAGHENLYNLGKEMFLEGNYTGAQDILAEFMHVSSDATLKEEAAYMMAVSSFHRGHEKSGEELKDFLATHPETMHRNEITFLVGSFHFDRKEWDSAKMWFNQSDLDYLTLSEQEDYSFRKGYTDRKSVV